MTQKENIQKQFDKLQQLRDELKVQLNLGKMEVRDSWEGMEKDFQKLEGHMKKFGERGEEEAERLREEAKTMIAKIRTGFENLKKQD
jgi:ElaB/YqjD/DUF883 family membrane-anchored ribosome-binding protein